MSGTAWPDRVTVTAYDPAWPAAFDRIAAGVRGGLRTPVIALDHIGSTAVPGLAAKPVIDLLLEVDRITDLDAETPEGWGFRAWGEYGIPGRRYFTRAAADGTRVAHLHAFATGDPGLARHRAFRDYLRAHPAIAADYGRLKLGLAARVPDIEAYMDGKDAFIRHHQAAALVWWPGHSD